MPATRFATPIGLRGLLLCCGVACCLALAACQGPPPAPTRWDAGQNEARITSGTEAQVQVKHTPEQIKQELNVAAGQAHWGVLNVAVHEQEQQSLAELTAELPDGRTAHVSVGWPAKKGISPFSGDKKASETVSVDDAEENPGNQLTGQSALLVKVGHFGDPAREQEFIDAFERRLEGKPRRIRGNWFELPEIDFENWSRWTGVEHLLGGGEEKKQQGNAAK